MDVRARGMDVRARVSAGRIMLSPEAGQAMGAGGDLKAGPGVGPRIGAGAGPENRAVALVQEDGTTCGATCVLAARLLYEREGAAAARLGALTGSVGGLQAALRVEQLRLQALMNRNAGGPLGPLAWPRHLGSTPWAVAGLMTCAVPREARASAVYTVTWVRDGGPNWATVVERLRAHLADDAPVLLVVGGPLVGGGEDGARVVGGGAVGARVVGGGAVGARVVGGGAVGARVVGGGAVGARVVGTLRRAARLLPSLPRHYVLALPWTLLGRADPGLGRVHVYDPASGAVGVVDLLAARDPQRLGPREFGNWPQVLAIIEPS
ncbi:MULTISPECIES: hypothetical protein [Actinomyces]|uniref:Uncharacterized protein n=1 Tax=Actinomyces respiraculi TaxID=2744574 RepID=A0A7T0LLW6_9ACTO|nr:MULTISPECIES: hypothetical protein [Actinomyces]QPL06105.1 hypothetical protein ID810_04030 [Actinomyces respiraculi]